MSQAVAYKRLKKMDNYKTVSPKSGHGPGPGVTVAHKMWSVTSGSNFDWKNFVICIDGSLWEVVAHEWWAHMEV